MKINPPQNTIKIILYKVDGMLFKISNTLITIMITRINLAIQIMVVSFLCRETFTSPDGGWAEMKVPVT